MVLKQENKLNLGLHLIIKNKRRMKYDSIYIVMYNGDYCYRWLSLLYDRNK